MTKTVRPTRWIIVVVVLAGVLALAPRPAGAATTFPDVPPGHPFATEIAWLAGTGITGGYDDGTFRPTAPITRQAFGAFLYRYDQATVAGGTSPFADVTASHPFVDEILWLADNDIANGYPDGTFRPTAPITRQALAAFLYRANGTPDASLDPVTPATPFSDVGADHPFAREIAWLWRSGIASGFPDGTFHPEAPVSRQSLAAFLYRMAGSPAPGAPGRNRADTAQTRVVDVASVVTATAGVDGTTVTLIGTAALPTVNQLVVIDAGGATPNGLIGRVSSVDAGQHRFVLGWAGFDEVYPEGRIDVARVVDGAPAVALAAQAGLPAAALDGCTGVDLTGTPAFRVLVRVRASWGAGKQPSMLVDLQARLTADGSLTTGGVACDHTFDLPIADIPLRAFVLGLPVVAGNLAFHGTVHVGDGAQAGLAGSLTTTHLLRFSLTDGHGTWSVTGGGALTNWTPVAFASAWEAGSTDVAFGPRLELSWSGAVGVDAGVDAVIGATVTPDADIYVTTSRGSRSTGQAHPERWFVGQAPWPTTSSAVDASAVYPSPKILTPFGLPAPLTGQPYAVTLLGANANPGTFALVAGTLPPGLALDDAGHISGTVMPNATNGQYAFTVAVTNAKNFVGSRAFVLTVDHPEIDLTPLPGANVGQPYAERNLVATGGAPGAQVWTILSGVMPPGMTLSSAGLISGKPTATGDYVLNVRVTDTAGQYDEELIHLAVGPNPLLSGWTGTVSEQINSKRCEASGWQSACYTFTFTSTITVNADGTQHVEYSDVQDSDTWWNGDGVTTPYCHMVAKLSLTSIGDDGDPANIIVTPGASGTEVSVDVTLPIHQLTTYDTQAGYCGDLSDFDEVLPHYAAAFPFDNYGSGGTGVPIDTAVTAPGDDYAGSVTGYFGDGQPYESVSSTYTWDLHRVT